MFRGGDGLLGVYLERGCNNGLDENGRSDRHSSQVVAFFLFPITQRLMMMMSSKLQRWAANKLDMRVAPRAEESQKASSDGHRQNEVHMLLG